MKLDWSPITKLMNDMTMMNTCDIIVSNRACRVTWYTRKKVYRLPQKNVYRMCSRVSPWKINHFHGLKKAAAEAYFESVKNGSWTIIKWTDLSSGPHWVLHADILEGYLESVQNCSLTIKCVERLSIGPPWALQADSLRMIKCFHDF